MTERLRWGIVSTGRIAGVFARALKASRTGTLAAVAGRTQASADAFGAEHGVATCYGSYQALLDDPAVQAVYLANLHPWHVEWAIKAADAGKHILCEKPLTINYPEALAMVEAARRNDVFLMEAFMYRCHPQTAKLAELLRNKIIGDVRVIQATFTFHSAFDPGARHLNNALGGGGIMDLGCYCMSMARLIAGADQGRDFADPIEVKGVGHLGDITRVDEWALADCRFPGDIVAQLCCGLQVDGESVVRIWGSAGHILVPTPWFPARHGGTSTILVTPQDGEPQEIVIAADRELYAIEADTVAQCIPQRQAAAPAMSWEDSLGNMRALDQWRAQIGLSYDCEQPANITTTVAGLPLAVRADADMPAGTIEGVTKPVSRAVMGSMAANSVPYAIMLYDDFFTKGGNAFDTAWVYGGGNAERLLGTWVRTRGVREQVVILAKGAHTPFCTPPDLTRQFLESLDRLQMDYVDLYGMHRDNPEIPAGEFIEAVNAQMRAGRIRAFVVSNWRLDRVEEANAYAKAKGLRGISAVSNNLSLARMVEAPWDGCVASSDATSRAWFTRTQLPLMSWSSQAQGFFAWGDSPRWAWNSFRRCWSAEDNVQRLARAAELGRQKGVSAMNIALAYVLNQPFPTFALVGPENPTETRLLLPGLHTVLTPEELAWLNLETERVEA